MPGIYELKIQSGNRPAVRRFAVNIDTTKLENDLSAINIPDLKKFLSPAKPVIINASKSVESDIITTIEGKELTNTFLGLALLLLGMEILLANKRK
jgi:hypothetical protein